MKIGLTYWLVDELSANSISSQARFGESLGFDSFWLPENHFNEIALPDPLMLLSAVSATTSSIKLGTSSYLLPLRNPLMAAEQVAILDNLSHGRLILGVGRGYATGTLKAFNVKPQEKRERFEWCLKIMLEAWAGKGVSLNDEFTPVNVKPLPIQAPHPPIWIAANHDNAIKRAARRGYSWYVNPHAGYETIKRQIELYHETAENADSGAPKKLPIMREVFVHDDRKTAFTEANKFLGGKYEAYSQWGQDKALPEDDEFSDEFVELAKDRFVIGNPEDCVQDLLKYKELGMEYGIFRMMYPGMSLNSGMQLLETFASKVMPHIK